MTPLDDKLAQWRRETERVRPPAKLLEELNALAVAQSADRPAAKGGVAPWLATAAMLGLVAATVAFVFAGAAAWEGAARLAEAQAPERSAPSVSAPALPSVTEPSALRAGPAPQVMPVPEAARLSGPERPSLGPEPSVAQHVVAPPPPAPGVDEVPAPPPAVPAPAWAGDVLQVKVGSVAPEETPWDEWLKRVKARIEKDTGGKVQLKVFLGGKLGGEKELVEETKNGNLEIFSGSTGAVATYVPELNVLELPFIFTSDAEADYVLDKTRDRFAKLLEAKGFVMVMWAENGWHGYGVKGKCLSKVEDMKGLTMRSQASYIHVETYKAFGASPVEMAAPEVLGALRTGTVDGYSNTPLFSFATSWYQGVTHYTYTRHIYQPGIMVLSKKWFDTLPEEHKQVLLVRSDERAGIDGVRALTGPLLDHLKAANKTVCTLTPAAAKGFEAKVKPVWDAFAKKGAGNKAILDAVLAAKKAFATQPK